MKFLILTAVVAICLAACNSIPDEVDSAYPTTIERLSDNALRQMQNDFKARNPYVTGTILNKFGFCDMAIHGNAATSGSFSKEEAIAAVKEFALRNPRNTGVNNPDELNFRNINQDVGYNNTVAWHFRTENQTINNIEVYNAQILFHTYNRALESSYGNWYPYVYVPKKFNYDAKKAKATLSGKITAGHLKESSARLLIIPVITDEKIELRVTWEINTPLYYIFCVDVMTGEIILEYSTIIS